MSWKFDDAEGMHDMAQICMAQICQNRRVTNDSTQQFPQGNKKLAKCLCPPAPGRCIKADVITGAFVSQLVGGTGQYLNSRTGTTGRVLDLLKAHQPVGRPPVRRLD